MNIITGILLTVCAVEDLKRRKISLLCPLIALITGTIFRAADGTLFGVECGLGIVVGGIFVLISLVSRQQIGLGDGLIIAACGLCLGWRKVCLLVLGAMILFLIVGVVRMLVFRLNGKSEVPFVPFLWIVFVGSVIRLP